VHSELRTIKKLRLYPVKIDLLAILKIN